MPIIQEHYNSVVDTERLFPESGDIEGYDTYLTGVACNIQPLDAAMSEDINGSIGKDWLMFCDVCDILEGDKVVNNSIVYKVVGVESYEFLGENRHMEVVIRKFNP